jgi:hypothetical protein
MVRKSRKVQSIVTTEILVVINGWVLGHNGHEHWLVGVPPTRLRSILLAVRIGRI